MTKAAEVLESRARQIRSRAAVRAWEYRQRNYARGVWYRLRRLLAEASDVYALEEADAGRLLAEGLRPEPVGAEFEPSKTILVVDRARLESIASKRALKVSLNAELLGSSFLALVPWPGSSE